MDDQRPTIVIRPKNPLRHRPDDLTGWAELLRKAAPDVEVVIDCEITPDDGKLGVTLVEVFRAYLPHITVASGYLLKIVQDVFVAWAKRRFVEPGASPNKPAKYLDIYGPDGTVVSRVRVEQGKEPDIR